VFPIDRDVGQTIRLVGIRPGIAGETHIVVYVAGGRSLRLVDDRHDGIFKRGGSSRGEPGKLGLFQQIGFGGGSQRGECGDGQEETW